VVAKVEMVRLDAGRTLSLAHTSPCPAVRKPRSMPPAPEKREITRIARACEREGIGDRADRTGDRGLIHRASNFAAKEGSPRTSCQRGRFVSCRPRARPVHLEGAPARNGNPRARFVQCRNRNHSKNKSGRPDSNRGPPAPKAGALPGYATPRSTSTATLYVSGLQPLEGHLGHVQGT